MTDEHFWELIASVEGSGGEDAHQRRVRAMLKRLAPLEVMQFEGRLRRHMLEAYVQPLWGAAMLLNGGRCGSSAWMAFRAWLVCRGREALASAIRDPDSLADADVTMTPDGPAARIAALIWDLDLCLMYWEEPDAATLQARYPRLWARYGSFKAVRDRQPRERDEDFGDMLREATLPGLGLVRLGDALVNRRTGEAQRVVSISDLQQGPGTFVGSEDSRYVLMLTDGCRTSACSPTAAIYRLEGFDEEVPTVAGDLAPASEPPRLPRRLLRLSEKMEPT